jgi:hypothetical protein
MRDFAIHLSHRPGELANVANALGLRGVNIKSVAGVSIGNEVQVRILADDFEAARSALRELNVRFEEGEIVTVLLENKAGELAGIAGKLANAGINLVALYVTGLEADLIELAIVADDPKKAKKLLE